MVSSRPPLPIDLTSVRPIVGDSAYARGSAYAREGRIAQSVWDPQTGTLLANVRGSGHRMYTATASLRHGRAGTWGLEGGECSCPMQFDCKHIAALVIAAATPDRAPATLLPTAQATWETSLGELLEPDIDAVAWEALALELDLSADAGSGEPQLTARLVRPGKRGGWVRGGLSWSGLDTLDRYSYGDSYDPGQVHLLRELYALYTATAEEQEYFYGYGEVKTIELTAVDSLQLWPLLEQVRERGIRLLHARARFGDVPPVGVAQLCLDVTGSAGLSVTPALRVNGEPAQPVRFFGAQGHGVVYRTDEPGDPRFIRLARLERPVPPALQRLAVIGQPLEVPEGETTRFRSVYYPRLRHTATVVSSDESFAPPSITGPTLVLRADYTGEHELLMGAHWRYDIDGEPVHHDPADIDPGYRDQEGERAIVTSLDGLPTADVDATAGLRIGETIAGGLRLTGMDTMRFTTEVLPRLREREDVAVEVHGEPPDYREVGDSLVIGVSAQDREGETDWFDLSVTISAEGRHIPFVQVFSALAAGEPYLLLPDGAYFSLDKPELVRLRSLIEEARALNDGPDDGLRVSRFQAGLFDELAELGVVRRQSAQWQQQVEGVRAIRSVEPVPAPESLQAELRPYQLEGFSWLTLLWRYGLGGILADDMGLGKTLQSLAMLCHVKQEAGDPAPFLVIAPSSVVSNWASEAARFAPGLRVVTVTDTLRRSGADLGALVAGADLVVTSYTLFRLDFAAHEQERWSGLILDEAQYVKNHQGKTYQCARKLTAPFKLAITGTPMENNLMELWSLLSITAPGLFPSPTAFAEYYAQPIEKGSDTQLLTQLRHRVRPLMKRRTKEMVAADLPEKQEQVIEVHLHPRHRTAYQRRLQRERQKVLGLLDDMTKNRFTILRSLTVLRQLALHAGLVDPEHEGLPCAKLDALMEQLRDVVDGGHRALVFSQFTGFLAHVRARLDTAEIGYCYLDGRTRKRAEVIGRFKEGTDPVFLISLKAGGFGLNLTEADYCFLLDPWWNPATEAQAVDRTHRIGQTRNVMVYRLLSADTIEEKVSALKNRKARLFRSVMDEGNTFGSALTAADIRGLLS